MPASVLAAVLLPDDVGHVINAVKAEAQCPFEAKSKQEALKARSIFPQR
jgi:hypothetical protein